MSDMDDLIAFLRARLDEDDAGARAASWDEWDGSHWTAHHREQYDGRWAVIDRADEGVIPTVAPQAADDAGVAQHIARHDPARALRQTAVLRDRVDLWSKMAGTHARTCLRAIAAIYADHPDYNDAWRP